MFLLSFFALVVLWQIYRNWKRKNMYKLASQVKGPFPLPFIGSAYKFIGNSADIFDAMLEMSQSYPDLGKMWFGDHLVYFTNKPEFIETILNSPHALAKTDLYKFLKTLAGDGLITAPVNIWKRHRKIILPTFHQKILDCFVETFTEQCQILLEKLESHADGNFTDCYKLVNNCTLDIICETSMGVQINAQKLESSFGQWANRALEITFLRGFVIFYHSDLIFYLTSLGKEQKSLIKKIHNFVDNVIVQKKIAYRDQKLSNDYESVKKRRVFLDLLVEQSEKEVEGSLTDEEIRDETITFMIAGSDTTATSNCFVFIMLGMHPDVQNKVYEEVIEVLGPNRQIRYSDLLQLKYTEQVIKETQRLFPAVSLFIRKLEDDLCLGEVTLSKNSSVVIDIFNLQRNSKYWIDPLTFNPERFSQGEMRHPYAYIPFSKGNRNCIGLQYAMMAMKTMIAGIVRKFELTTPYKSVEEIKLKNSIVLRPREGFNVGFKLRK